MNTIELDTDQILDLIFEKKITYGNIRLSGTHSFLAILSKLEERLSDGKVLRGADTIFCGTPERQDNRVRGHAVEWSKHGGRRKTLDDCIGNL